MDLRALLKAAWDIIKETTLGDVGTSDVEKDVEKGAAGLWRPWDDQFSKLSHTWGSLVKTAPCVFCHVAEISARYHHKNDRTGNPISFSSSYSLQSLPKCRFVFVLSLAKSYQFPNYWMLFPIMVRPGSTSSSEERAGISLSGAGRAPKQALIHHAPKTW